VAHFSSESLLPDTADYYHFDEQLQALADQVSQGIGVDLECAEGNDQKLLRRVLTPTELHDVDPFQGSIPTICIVAHFAVKEAIYKSLGPDEQLDVDFEDIELALPPLSTLNSLAWLQIAVRLHGRPLDGRVALIVDHEWVLAVASRT